MLGYQEDARKAFQSDLSFLILYLWLLIFIKLVPIQWNAIRSNDRDNLEKEMSFSR